VIAGPIRASAAVAVGVIALAGCGSSSKSSSSSAPAITKAEFLAKANAICRAGNARQTAAGAKVGKSPSAAQVKTLVTKVFIPDIQSQINAVRALGAPKGDEATVSGFLNLAQADLDRVKANPLLIVGNASPFHDFAAKAHPYGLTACAQGA
jgi:hypothetical protein